MFLLLAVAHGNELVGSWSYTDPRWGQTTTLQLAADGSGALDGEGFRYARVGEQLVIEIDGERLVYSVKVAGDQLTAFGGDLEGTLVFTRSGSPAAVPAAAPAAPAVPAVPAAGAAFVGTWTDGQGVIAFHADGACDYVGQRLSWTSDGAGVVLTGSGGTVRLPAKVEGDRLIVTGEGGQTQTLVRQGSAERPSPVEPPAADASGLAGVYVASEGSVDPTYAMSITQYLVLWPDGTVGWSKSELGASRVQVSDSLQRFSSFRTNPSAKGATYGTWQAVPGGVVVQWQIWNGLRSEGRLDMTSGALTLSGMGILNEGASLTYTRQ